MSKQDNPLNEGSQGQLASILHAGEQQLLSWGVEHDFSLKVAVDALNIWHTLDCESNVAIVDSSFVVMLKDWIKDPNDLCACIPPALERIFLILEHAHEKVIISLAVSLRDEQDTPPSLTGKIVFLSRLQRVYYESLRVIAWSGAENSKVNNDLAKPLQNKIASVRDDLARVENYEELVKLGVDLALKLNPELSTLSLEVLKEEVLYHIEEMRIKDFISHEENIELELEEEERYTLAFLKEWGSHIYAARIGFSETLPYILTSSPRWLYELTKQKWEVSKFWNPSAPLVKEAIQLWSESDDLAPYASMENALVAADKLFK